MKKKITFFIFFLAAAVSFSYGQKPATGKVIDRTTREPLEGALVHDSPSGANTFTDLNGRFVLPKIKRDSLHIEVSFVGYKPVHLTIPASSPGAKAASPGTGAHPDLIIEMEKSILDMKAVVITGNGSFNTFHTLSQIDLNMQPAKSAQDLLRLVPGLFIAQHQGGGKAEQIFLRGFDADHGTDVNVSVDGLPVNMVSQAHGQGYADLHFLIPETVAGYDFGKGPYYSDKGDFTTAGYIEYHTINTLDRNLVKLEGGQFNSGRAVAMFDLLGKAAKDKGQSAYVAGEVLYSDGPFDYPEHFNRANLFGKFVTPLGNDNRLTLSLSTLSSQWRASGEIPNRAVAEGYSKDRFGAIDSAQGGYTSRTNAGIRLVSNWKNNFTLENQAYYSHYFFNLLSNFTFYYFYPTTGDEFRQHEERDLLGYTNRLSHSTRFDSGGWLDGGALLHRSAPAYATTPSIPASWPTQMADRPS